MITFSRGEDVKYISHLDIMRLWQRALRRAGMPMAYSQGFNPHPRISIAAPLAVSVTSDGELMDVLLARNASLDFFVRAVGSQLPLGIKFEGIREMWLRLPSLQSQLRFAEYRVGVESSESAESVESAIRSIMQKESLPWQHAREKEIRRYDLRALIEDLWLIDQNEFGFTLGMRLHNDSKGAGRPEQVALALGFPEPPRSIHRTALILDAN